MTLRAAARTDVGKRRKANEDAYGSFDDLSLYVVADGVGGHAGGEVASAMAVDAIQRALAAPGESDLTPVSDASGRLSLAGRVLMVALLEANERILDAAVADPKLHGMGAAVVAALFDDKYHCVALCHVGDARAYRVRGRVAEQLTEDHTLVRQLLKEGQIEEDELASSPHRHVLTQALGTARVVHPSLRLEQPLPGDFFVLCSDGIHDVVGPDEIAEAVQRATDVQAACDRLVELANERGGPDNSTVLVVACGEPAPAGGSDDEPTIST